jgi:two-component system LytT family sensor kinase
MSRQFAAEQPADQMPVVDAPARLTWPVVGVAFAAAGLLRFAYVYLDDVTRARPGTLETRVIEEITGAAAALLLFPAIAWLERRRPLSAGRWRGNWPWHVLALLLYSVAHTTLMAVSRWTIFPLLGLGAYDYGILSVRYFMEAPNDAIAYAVLLGVLTLIRVQKRLQWEQLHAAALARDAAEARLEVLSLRLQPHFLFNALNTISSTVYTDPVAADVMIGQLGDLLRHALRTSDRPEIALAEEVDVLRGYLAIVEARFGDRITCTLSIAPDTEQLAVPAFLLQPLVENAVRHGSASVDNRGRVEVSAALAGDMLRLIVENDLSSEALAARTDGTGLTTTADRLRLLYGDRHRFAAGADAGRFRVTLELPARPAVAPVTDSSVEPTYASSHR